MAARFTQLAVVSLLAGAATLQAADDEASVKLTGVAEFDNQRYALLEIVSRPGRPVIEPILAPGERIEGVEVKEIDARSGRVPVVIKGVETFYLAVYASLLVRKPLPVDRSTPAVKPTVRTQTSLTRAEAISAVDTVAALNRLQFVLVGDDEVKILPAALARRETNLVQ